MLSSLTRSGDLVQMRRGVYATKRAVKWAETDQVRRHLLYVLAARATAGPDAIASYQSAAVLHRLDLLDSRPVDHVTLTVPPSRRWERAKAADVVFHSANLPSGHVGKLYRVPVTTAARTVADLARTVPFTDAVVRR
jgi:predicted transcriptional regulator of viral defense system